MSDAFGEITEATVTFVESHELTNSGGTPRYFDFNEDGIREPYAWPDVLASIAYYLRRN